MNDDSIMPYGKFKGTKLENVPAWYLLGILVVDDLDVELEQYILDNEEALIKETLKDTR